MKVGEVDELLALPARLAILATAADGQRWSFSALGDETGLADGNLHVQTRKLVEAGYLERSTERQGNRRVTVFELTGRGRAALRSHVDRLHDAISEERRHRPAEPRRGELSRPADPSRVW